jgi:hypothetical protein
MTEAYNKSYSGNSRKSTGNPPLKYCHNPKQLKTIFVGVVLLSVRKITTTTTVSLQFK